MKVNGQHVNLERTQSLFDYLITQKYDITKIAIEHNGVVVPRAAYKDLILNDRDSIEIVKFVGGG